MKMITYSLLWASLIVTTTPSVHAFSLSLPHHSQHKHPSSSQQLEQTKCYLSNENNDDEAWDSPEDYETNDNGGSSSSSSSSSKASLGISIGSQLNPLTESQVADIKGLDSMLPRLMNSLTMADTASRILKYHMLLKHENLARRSK